MTNVRSEIYLITCLDSGKQYVGQTQTHTLNHGKYRPFGYMRRWTAHVSEAIKNNKKKQCIALNNSIRKYGKNQFKVELLHNCNLSFANYFEKMFINEYNTIAPNGYNLTSEESKERIRNTVTELWKDPEIKQKYSNAQVSKNDKIKLDKYLPMGISEIEIKKMWFSNHKRDGVRCILRVGGTQYRMEFCGKQGTFDEFLSRARNVCKEICPNVIEIIN
jgi:hypothetical protein